MKADRLEYEGFRNLKAGEFRPSEGVNIVYGDNGQGKTNLLEALWLFTGGRELPGGAGRGNEGLCGGQGRAAPGVYR